MFDERQARRDLKRWRTKGLRTTRATRSSSSRGEQVETVLEIGGGIGAAQVELLRRGVERTTNVELSPGYEEVARRARARGGRRRARSSGCSGTRSRPSLPDADAVLLNRVVCCYPDYEALLAVSAAHARRFLVFTFPRSGGSPRPSSALGNLLLRLGRRDFRAYAHPRAALVGAAERHGLRLVHERRALVWQTVAFARA